MADFLHDYSQQAVNWRESIRRNRSRTYQVIGLFVLIYIALGVVLDLFIRAEFFYPTVPLGEIFKALITFQILPIATIVTLIIALVSLWVTYAMCDKIMLLGTHYKQLTGDSKGSLMEQQIYHVVEEMTIAAGMKYTPKVYLIDADYMNAFASGYSEKSAMVAITRGLAEKLNRSELQAVMAHEISHIRHQDIKLTLTAVVLSNLMLMIIDILFYSVIFSGGRRGRGGRGGGNYLFLIIMILRFLLPLITVILTLYLSRTREYMADAGAIELMRDNKPLANALIKIQQDHQLNREQYSQSYRQTAHEAIRRESYIFDPIQSGIESVKSVSETFSTHPGFEKRLAALGFKKAKQ